MKQGDVVRVDRAEVRPCDKCKGPLQGGMYGVVDLTTKMLTESSVRGVASMETYFGPGNERLAHVMSPGLEARVGHCDHKVLCVNCLVDVMSAMAHDEAEVA